MVVILEPGFTRMMLFWLKRRTPLDMNRQYWTEQSEKHLRYRRSFFRRFFSDHILNVL